MKRLLVVFIFSSLLPILQAERVVYLLPISIEGTEYSSSVFMSVKQRSISTNDKEKYKMSKMISGFDKADNPSEAVASEIIDAVYKDDKVGYSKINKGRSEDKTKSDSTAGYQMYKEILGYSDYVYFVNEFEIMGLKIYETNIAPTLAAKNAGMNNQDNSFFLAIGENDYGFEHRFDALTEPVIQCLISASIYARKQNTNKDLKDLVKISYSVKFDDVKSNVEGIDFYVKIIKPLGNTLFFKGNQLCKTDFSKETNGIWKFYADIWNDLKTIPDANDFKKSAEYERFLGHLSKDSGRRKRSELEKFEVRPLIDYKSENLRYKKVLFAIDADPVYFVFYSTVPNGEYIYHDTIFRDANGYKLVNYGYYSDMERLLDSKEFVQELVRVMK